MKVRQAIGNALQVQVAIHALAWICVTRLLTKKVNHALDKSDCVHKLGGLTLLG